MKNTLIEKINKMEKIDCD